MESDFVLCSKCNMRQGKIHIINNNKNETKEYILCDECAKKFEEYDLETSFTDNDFLTSVIESIEKSPLKVNYIMTTSCKRCGMTYGNYRKMGRAGCSECYISFFDKITAIISNIQGTNTHIGKSPANYVEYTNVKKEISLLKRKLREEVKKEKFENAAKLRDKISNLEKDINKG